MKTSISALLIAFCLSASAVQVDWTVVRGSFGTSSGGTYPNGYLVTIFLASDLTAVQSAFTTSKSAEEISTAISSKIFSSGATAYGQASGNVNVTGTYTSGTDLDIFAVAWDASSIAGASNYLISSQWKTSAYEAPSTPVYDGKTSTAFAGSTWTAVPAVPEPATGALALAGIALLLKRRKAVKA